MAVDYRSLADIAPITAAGMMGQDQEQAVQSESLRQRELQQIIADKMQAHDQLDQMNPLLVAEKQWQNRGLEAGLPGIVGDSEKKVAAGKLATGTLASDILAGNAKNQGTVEDERNKSQDRQESFFLSAGTSASKLPPPLRMNGIIQEMRNHGIDPSSGAAQEQLRRLADMDPEKYPEYFQGLARAHGLNKALQTPGYHEKMDQEAFQQRGATDRNDATIQGQKDLEQMRIDAGKYNKNKLSLTTEQLIAKAPNARARFSILNDAAMVALQGGDTQEAANYRARAETQRIQAEAETGAANAGKVDVSVPTHGRVPMVAPPSISPQNFPDPGTPAQPAAQPAAQPQAHSLADVQRQYPGIPPAKLKELYKRKFGVNLQ